MSKTIKMKLSTASVKEAIRQVKDYQEELKRKTSLFVQRLAEVGINEVNAHKSGRGDANRNDLQTYVKVEQNGSRAKAILTLHGEDVAFIEFGAGISYNGAGGQSPNPYGAPLGMIIGSYGKGHGLEESWTYYDESKGQFVTTYGTEASMPMYYADQEILNQITNIAREVFES